MKESEPIRIAQIIGKWLGGGVESVVMNYYRNIDHNKLQFDFFCDEDSTNIPYEEIEKLGGKVILIPPYQNVFKYQRTLKKILKDGKYKIIHSHINTLSVFPLYAAKKAGVPIRIAHSHSTTNKKEWKKNLIKQFLRPFSKKYATNYMACSEHAGRWMFGNKEFNNKNVYILNNAIDFEKFRFDRNKRKSIRKELNINDDTYVIGHIGRFVEQKNHRFIIDVFDKYQKKNKNSILMLIGQGPLELKMKQKVKKLNIEDKVLFLGQKENINDYYNTMDLFLFPSLYEGLGIVMIEAQANGIPCVASTEVPTCTKINEPVEFIKLSDDISVWVNCINSEFGNKRKHNTINLKENSFNIKNEAKKLEKKYELLYERQ